MRQVRLASGRVLHCKVEFRCADRTVMAASGLCLQSWLIQLHCDLQGNDGRSQGNCFVNRWYLEERNRTKHMRMSNTKLTHKHTENSKADPEESKKVKRVEGSEETGDKKK